MQLLVSVSGPDEARTAVAGGADIIDAKDPASGPLGPVSLDVLRAIRTAVGETRVVTAALGDARSAHDVERDAGAFVAAGAALVKVGFAGITDLARIQSLIAAAVRGAGGQVIAVAYADGDDARSAGPAAVLDAAVRAGAAGLLVDTADKRGPGLLALMPPDAITRIVARARGAGLLAALAGQLTADDLLCVRDSGAHIAGVRGAACDGGRAGRISAARVERLLRHLGRADLSEDRSCVVG